MNQLIIMISIVNVIDVNIVKSVKRMPVQA